MLMMVPTNLEARPGII